jgi:hypothetical protein
MRLFSQNLFESLLAYRGNTISSLQDCSATANVLPGGNGCQRAQMMSRAKLQLIATSLVFPPGRNQ